MPLSLGIMQQKRRGWQLKFQPFIAPSYFDPDAQPLNIFETYRSYYSSINKNARFIYSFTSSIATLTLSVISGVTYRWGETISGVDYVYDVSSGTAFTAGSTKRYVIVNSTSATLDMYGTANLKLPLGSVWAYFGDVTLTYICGTESNTYAMYIHCSDVDCIKGFARYAFRLNSNLTGNIYLPNVNINFSYAGDRIFDGCTKLVGELIIPDNWVNIGSTRLMFSGCTGFTSITLGASLKSIGQEMFQSCTNVTAINWNCDLLESIGAYAFSGLTKVTGTLTLPDTLISIGAFAFWNNGYTGTLTIPSTVTTIGEGAFAAVSFDSITSLSANFTVDASGGDTDVLYDIGTSLKIKANYSAKSGSGTLIFKSDCTEVLSYCCYSNSTKTGSLTIPSSVTRIGSNAFYGCSGFTGSFTIPSSVLSIEGSAFVNCSGLTGTLTIPNTVTSLGTYTFQACRGFTSLVIGTGLSTLPGHCFRNMTGLVGDLTIPDNITTLGGFVFHECANYNGTLTLSANLTGIGSGDFYNTKFTGTLNIPASITTIYTGTSFTPFSALNLSVITSSSTNYPAEDNVLYDCKTSGQIQAYISAKAYSGTLTLKTGTTKILDNCFYNNSNRTGTLTILSTVTNINTSAFYGCSGFTGLVFDGTSAILTIGATAFYNCPALTGTLTLPASLSTVANSIGASAFSGVNIANRPSFTVCNSYNNTQPGAATNAFAFQSGGVTAAIPLHVLTGTSSYTTAPWTTTTVFSSIIKDL